MSHLPYYKKACFICHLGRKGRREGGRKKSRKGGRKEENKEGRKDGRKEGHVCM